MVALSLKGNLGTGTLFILGFHTESVVVVGPILHINMGITYATCTKVETGEGDTDWGGSVSSVEY